MVDPTAPKNPWDVLHEDVKLYITLATALLGISATFANRLLSNDEAGRVVVIIGWFALGVSIAVSTYASGAVFASLKQVPLPTTYRPAPRLLNATLVCLGIGTVCLAFGAWRTSLKPSTQPVST